MYCKQDRPVIGEWERRVTAVAVEVEPLVVDQPQVIALAEVVAQADVRCEEVVDVAELNEGVHRELGVERRADSEPSDVRVETLLAVGETHGVELVLEDQFQVTGYIQIGTSQRLARQSAE